MTKKFGRVNGKHWIQIKAQITITGENLSYILFSIGTLFVYFTCYSICNIPSSTIIHITISDIRYMLVHSGVLTTLDVFFYYFHLITLPLNILPRLYYKLFWVKQTNCKLQPVVKMWFIILSLNIISKIINQMWLHNVQ